MTGRDITIDLNGFTILRNGAGGTGIHFKLTARNGVVRNGTVRGFEQGIYARPGRLGWMISLFLIVQFTAFLPGIRAGYVMPSRE